MGFRSRFRELDQRTAYIYCSWYTRCKFPEPPIHDLILEFNILLFVSYSLQPSWDYTQMTMRILIAESKFSTVLQLLLSDSKVVSLLPSILEQQQEAILVWKYMNRVLGTWTWSGSISASGTVKKVIEINPYLLGTMAGGAGEYLFITTGKFFLYWAPLLFLKLTANIGRHTLESIAVCMNSVTVNVYRYLRPANIWVTLYTAIKEWD